MEKTPRLRPHESTPGHFDHPSTNRYIRQYEQKIGQMSLTAPIPTEAPTDLEPRDLAEVTDLNDRRDPPPIAA